MLDVTLYPGSKEVEFVALTWRDVPRFAGTGPRFATFWVQEVSDPDTIRCLTHEDALQNRSRDALGDALGEQQCALFPVTARDVTASTFLFSSLALGSQKSARPTDWGALEDDCGQRGTGDRDYMLFAASCVLPNSSASLSCAWASASVTRLVRVSCRGQVLELHLQSLQSQLQPTGCVRDGRFEASSRFCAEAGDLAANWTDWDCFTEGDFCIQPAASDAGVTFDIPGFTACNHTDRYVLKLVACLDASCAQQRMAADVVEFDFTHYSGIRAVECLAKPSVTAAKVGKTAVAVVGGAVAAGVGASLGSSAGASSAASSAIGSSGAGAGIFSILGAAQFVAFVSDTCAMQSSNEFSDLITMISGFKLFNLQIPVPNILKQASPALQALQLCGEPPVDLIEQARADAGPALGCAVIQS